MQLLTRLALCVVAIAAVVRPLAGQNGADDKQASATLLRYCQHLDSSSTRTLQTIRDRTDCWKRLQLQGVADSAVNERYEAAVADYDTAMVSDSVRRAVDAIDGRLAAALRLVQVNDYAGAARDVGLVLAVQPDNERALALRDRVAALQRAATIRTDLFRMAAAVLVCAVLLLAGSRMLSRRHATQVAARAASASQQQAVLEIIDGIGRGKMYTIDGPIFRIGSAASDRPDEKNDLILSDGDAFISRFHCAIVRRDGRFYLIDSSLNGTYIDEDLLDRGEHRELVDGAEFSLAGMARVKFLLM
ncbi:MAG TPA: FHA domain-containing protein [Gemmatimonadales bacterium]|jgi:hypothetical protein